MTSGDKETVECYSVGRNVRVVLGLIPTVLGKPKPGNGRLEIRGGDKVKITYLDQSTSEGNVPKKVDERNRRCRQCHGGHFADGAGAETLAAWPWPAGSTSRSPTPTMT